MNQILNYYDDESYNSSKENVKNYKFILIISIIICIILIIIHFFSKYNSSKNDKLSKNLVSNFSLSTLYTNSTDEYSAIRLDETSNEPFVIGLIKIDKINLLYPILSKTNNELLKLSPCRYSGPLPNMPGNLCIAGHNYVDNKLFSKINILKIGDIIRIYDMNGNFLDYSIFDIYEVPSNDTSCTNQINDGKKYVTLITCNNVTGLRLIVKCESVT